MLKRRLAVNDYFPDLVLEDGEGHPFHSASFGGYTVCVWLCGRDSDAAHRQRSAMAKALGRELPSVIIDCTNEQRVSGALKPCQSELADFFFAESAPDQYCCILRRDGKIAWLDSAHPNPEQWRSIMATQNTGAAQPPVLIVDHVLSTGLTQRLIDSFDHHPNPVQGRVGLSQPSFDPTRKRVKHVNIERELSGDVDQALMYSLLPMIERCFDFRVTHRVSYKVSQYDSRDDAFFHAHRDNSDQGTRYRHFALSVSLNDDWHGEGLRFPEFGSRSYRGKAGSAIVFPASLLHEVVPVVGGCRYVLLSFLYAEPGAALRRADMKDPGILDRDYPDAFQPDLIAEYRSVYAPQSRYSPSYTQARAEPDFIVRWRNEQA